MVEAGVSVLLGISPTRIVKLHTGRLEVTYSNGKSDQFDTVIRYEYLSVASETNKIYVCMYV